MPTSSSSSQAKDSKPESRYSWWNWRRSRPSREATPAPDAVTTTDSTTKEISSVVEIKEVDELAVTKTEVESKCCVVLICKLFDYYCLFVFVEVEAIVSEHHDESPTSPASDKFKKSLRLSSDQIVSCI